MLKSINDLISFLLELAMLASFAYAGFHYGDSRAINYLLGIGIPVLVIVFWAKKMAPKAVKRFPYPWILIITLILFEASAAALLFAGVEKWAIVLSLLALINIGLRFLFKKNILPHES